MASNAGLLLISLLAIPMFGMGLTLLTSPRGGRGLAAGFLIVNLGVSIWVLNQIETKGHPLSYQPGGWLPPLGITLQADGLSAIMLLTTAVITLVVALTAPRAATPPAFWILLLGIGGAMNAVFLGRDLFNLYVALELVSFGAVPLVCLSGNSATLLAALRYLLFALAGSVLYLLGAGLLYGQYGTLDITLLAERVEFGPALTLATALMIAGLAAKTAIFPFHFWLPPAHAGAAPAASALLSALVIKASFFITFRLWFEVLPGHTGEFAGQLLGAMGAGGILLGGILAMRQTGLKMLIAYSTLAQIGYLFLIFPLAGSPSVGSPSVVVGGMLQIVSHAFAKASMFLAAGLIVEAFGHDRIRDLRGMASALPLTLLAFGIASLSLLGVPPSGGFLAKWILLTASVTAGQWIWVVVIALGGLLAGGYVFRVLGTSMAEPDQPLVGLTPVSRVRQCLVLALAVASMLLGAVPQRPLELLRMVPPTSELEGRQP